jgi:DUF4097 and DUF4098 domain-containing protein YvlB
VVLGGCDITGDTDATHKVNGSVHVAAGAPLGSAESINGAIHVDANTAVTKAATVNGSIRLGAHASADSAKTVNGSITLEEGVHVAGDVVSVNGVLSLAKDAEVKGRVQNVSGRIELDDAHVGGALRTVAGDISVLGSSHVDGGILVEKGGTVNVTIGREVPRIVIGPGATVQGELRFEREVRLFVSDRATVGAVTGATPVTFSGDTAPN